ncbi:MAG: ComEA family DNA-binding protein [Cellulomonas sp.]|jgi:competence protein ComEA|nr:ComEA family DNA-binding protein [Cellulomonas sp.]
MADLPPSRQADTPTGRLGIVAGLPAVGQSPDRALDGTAQAADHAAARSVAALRRARAEYLARHEPAAAPPSPRRWAVSRRLGLAAAGVVVLVAAAVGLRAGTAAGGALGGPVELATPSPPEASVSGVVVVHVVGAVTVPGVVTLPDGSRVADAIEAAGGAADADLAGVNLARPLVDGEQLYVPRPGEVVPGAPAEADDGLIDLNRATQAELEELPGVGPVLAGRITDARPFASVDDLDRVSGIGPATMTKLRDLVKV